MTLTADEIAATVNQADNTMQRLATIIGAQRHVPVAGPVVDYVFTRAEQIEQAEKGVGAADPFPVAETRTERRQGIAPLSPVEWLGAYLAAAVPSLTVFADAEKAGFSAQQMKRAKTKLGVRAVKVRNVWFWQPVA